jgi:UPF0716 family protein affecting phage T7 exclusion
MLLPEESVSVVSGLFTDWYGLLLYVPILSSSVSISLSAVVQRANFNERVVRMLTTLPKFEGDDIETEEDNIGTYSKRPYQSVKRPELPNQKNL